MCINSIGCISVKELKHALIQNLLGEVSICFFSGNIHYWSKQNLRDDFTDGTSKIQANSPKVKNYCKNHAQAWVFFVGGIDFSVEYEVVKSGLRILPAVTSVAATWTKQMYL